jgi:hypothetical protein
MHVAVHVFAERAGKRNANDIYPQAEIKIVDGEMFSWYGSRLALAPSYFKTLRP